MDIDQDIQLKQQFQDLLVSIENTHFSATTALAKDIDDLSDDVEAEMGRVKATEKDLKSILHTGLKTLARFARGSKS